MVCFLAAPRPSNSRWVAAVCESGFAGRTKKSLDIHGYPQKNPGYPGISRVSPREPAHDYIMIVGETVGTFTAPP